jgi:hypothetical protein
MVDPEPHNIAAPTTPAPLMFKVGGLTKMSQTKYHTDYTFLLSPYIFI